MMKSKLKTLAGIIGAAILVSGCSGSPSSSGTPSASGAGSSSAAPSAPASQSESQSQAEGEEQSGFRADKERTLTVFTTESGNQIGRAHV